MSLRRHPLDQPIEPNQKRGQERRTNKEAVKGVHDQLQTELVQQQCKRLLLLERQLHAHLQQNGKVIGAHDEGENENRGAVANLYVIVPHDVLQSHQQLLQEALHI